MIETLRRNANFPNDSGPGRSPRFSPAWLMSPGEAQNVLACQPHEVQERAKKRWLLCGELSQEMFCLIEAEILHSVALRISAFKSPIGVNYGVVSHQVLGHAHRFLLPLYEPRVGDFLLGMRQARLGFLLGRDGEKDVVSLTTPAGGTAGLLPLLSMADPLPSELIPYAITELPSVISALNEPEQVPSCREGEPVVAVNVSVVMPSQTLQRFLDIRTKG
jgi:hypothetical protein